MNCFNYIITKRKLREIEQTGIFTTPVFQQQFSPNEGDRVCFSNFKQIFSIEKIMPAKNEAELIDQQIGEATRPYLVGFFDLALRRLYDDFKIVNIAELSSEERYREIVPAAGGACDMYAKFEAEIAIVEAESEYKIKTPETDIPAIVAQAKARAAKKFYGRILPSAFEKYYQISCGRCLIVRHDPVIAYLDRYHPIAMMLFYWEYDPENEELEESIPAAFIDTEVASRFGLTIRDVQYIVEELLGHVVMGFDPRTDKAVLKKPTIVVPVGQAIYYQNLIDCGNWSIGGGKDFGYYVYN